MRQKNFVCEKKSREIHLSSSFAFHATHLCRWMWNCGFTYWRRKRGEWEKSNRTLVYGLRNCIKALREHALCEFGKCQLCCQIDTNTLTHPRSHIPHTHTPTRLSGHVANKNTRKQQRQKIDFCQQCLPFFRHCLKRVESASKQTASAIVKLE